MWLTPTSGGDQIVRNEELELARLAALGLGRYDSIRALEAGVDGQRVEWLVRDQGCPLALALELAR
ncbi:MAG TPA: hypothetical protein VFB35_09285 [Gaiellaceae bacterium]|nr:hypothetical protein [Gaiellaceae bacterium]